MSYSLEDPAKLTDEEVCRRIATLTMRMMDFWKDARGWAPVEAADLMNRSMLEWQASLATSLHRWISAETQGDLILAWANLGALAEGQLKLFLSVHYLDYKADADAMRCRKGKLQDPDGCTLEPLRQFFIKRIWRKTPTCKECDRPKGDTWDACSIIDSSSPRCPRKGDSWDEYLEMVQHRRNAIHAFKLRDIGTFDEWKLALRQHLEFAREINSRLPYPDEIYGPTEV